jgi:hypothetical protein
VNIKASCNEFVPTKIKNDVKKVPSTREVTYNELVQYMHLPEKVRRTIDHPESFLTFSATPRFSFELFVVNMHALMVTVCSDGGEGTWNVPHITQKIVPTTWYTSMATSVCAQAHVMA